MVVSPTKPVRQGHRADLIAVAVAAVLLITASVVGVLLNRPDSGVLIHANAPPIYGRLAPHLGPGTPLAVLLLIAVVVWGPTLAARLSWRRLLGAGYLAAVAWTLALAMVDGWQAGIVNRLTHRTEYLHEVPGITDIGVFLRTFVERISLDNPDFWTTHVSGHPPGATLSYVWLDRLGLSGGGAAGLVTILIGCLTAVAVPVTMRELGASEQARASLPFIALFPGAVWVGVSADGLFAGVASLGLALFVFGARRWRPLCLPAGMVLGFALYLSYGLVLFGVLVFVAWLLFRDAASLVLGLAGVASVVVAFALAGFWWYDGYQALVTRYYQGFGGERPYAYWVWANLASVLVVIGPAAVAGMRRVLARLPDSWRVRGFAAKPVVLLCLAALVAILLADLSGLSKAEVERIWLPFAVWLLPATALLPAASARWWLAGQGIVALAVNHLLWIPW
ncbi:hypothetical protein EV191_10592 [Tamaricihabitans halophyticus]|uniref:Integral membrane protein n=1 Tax=Tamaricihabitans halophyticus TaxID=1262583 RepID=A0A4R2QSZ9_9PSEU|nr:hypothetical protein [Tamaricihabitans halophyticus]TCP53030.1 hypothetical protein EV191_10592 [Tamaricihabitans halophyticus]